MVGADETIPVGNDERPPVVLDGGGGSLKEDGGWWCCLTETEEMTVEVELEGLGVAWASSTAHGCQVATEMKGVEGGGHTSHPYISTGSTKPTEQLRPLHTWVVHAGLGALGGEGERCPEARCMQGGEWRRCPWSGGGDIPGNGRRGLAKLCLMGSSTVGRDAHDRPAHTGGSEGHDLGLLGGDLHVEGLHPFTGCVHEVPCAVSGEGKVIRKEDVGDGGIEKRGSWFGHLCSRKLMSSSMKMPKRVQLAGHPCLTPISWWMVSGESWPLEVMSRACTSE